MESDEYVMSTPQLFESIEPKGEEMWPSSEADCDVDARSSACASDWPRSVRLSAEEPPSSKSTESCFAMELRVKLVDVPPSVSSARIMSLKQEPHPLLLDVLVSQPVALPHIEAPHAAALPPHAPKPPRPRKSPN